LKDSSTIQLAIKKSEDPPAAWVHNECHIGSQISLCCGGDFFYDGSRRSLADLLLIAGGVGITPVASIVQHAIELREESDKNQTSPAVNQIVLLYSAVEKDELLFENRFRSLSARHPFFQANFYITGKNYNGCVPEGFHFGRIHNSLLRQTVQSLDRSHLLCYVCGPPPMTDSIFAALKESRVDDSRILCEKWW
jgi:ferredoxin-NADP reductase